MKFDRKVFAFVTVFSIAVISTFALAIGAAKASCDGYYYGQACNQQSASVAMSTPQNVNEGQTVYESMNIQNNAQYGRNYHIDVFVCRSDGYDSYGCGSYNGCDVNSCAEMSCDSNDIYISANGYHSVGCSLGMHYAGHYKVKLMLSEDGIGSARTFYSSDFTVFNQYGTTYPSNYCAGDGCQRYNNYNYNFNGNYPCVGSACGLRADEKSTADYRIGDYRCFGSYRQQLFADGWNERVWKLVDYCPYGCQDGKCTVPTSVPKTGSPEMYMPKQYDAARCQVTQAQFSVKNTGSDGSFDLKVSGDAAAWVEVAPSVAVAQGETKQVTAFVSVPCDAAAGEHSFTITAVGATMDSRTTSVTIQSISMFNTQLSDIFVLLVLVVIVAALVFKRDDVLAYFKHNMSKNGKEEKFCKPI
ncbi:MAG: hypothetical protein NT016_02755 [Candidatus Aenigmarchaeota archaeon]|nr:hypothetical protein [Candidatus Aenigmarchaeota archaeon]